MVWLSRTDLGRGLKKGFEVVGRVAAERGMAPLSVVVDHLLANFQVAFGQAGKGAAVEQFGFEPLPKGLDVDVVVAVVSAVNALHRPVLREHRF